MSKAALHSVPTSPETPSAATPDTPLPAAPTPAAAPKPQTKVTIQAQAIPVVLAGDWNSVAHVDLPVDEGSGCKRIRDTARLPSDEKERPSNLRRGGDGGQVGARVRGKRPLQVDLKR